MPKKSHSTKALAYVYIEPRSDVGRVLYERLYAIVDAHHEELSQRECVATNYSLSTAPRCHLHSALLALVVSTDRRAAVTCQRCQRSLRRERAAS